MTAEKKVKQVYPNAICHGTPRRITIPPDVIDVRISGPYREIGRASAMQPYNPSYAWADAWRRIQATTETPEAK